MDVEVITRFIEKLDELGKLLFDTTDPTKDVEAVTSMVEVACDDCRQLRNACAGSKDNQDLLNGQHEEHGSKGVFHQLHESVTQICKVIKEKERPETLLVKLQVLVRCCLQLLGNSTVQNRRNASVVWKLFLDLFSDLLTVPDDKVCSYTCMVIHSCVVSQPAERVSQLVTTDSGRLLLCSILSCLTSSQQEWGIYIIEKCLGHPEFLPNITDQLATTHKCLICELVLSSLKKQLAHETREGQRENDDNICVTCVSEANISVIRDNFKSQANRLLELTQTQDMDSQEEVLVTVELDVMCEAAALRGGSNSTTADQELLTATIHLLHCLHLLGKQSENQFSTVSKASEMATVDQTHPVYGLKCDLIRLLANMAYKHKLNQDKVRELGGIPLVMNHTNIDGRNPFITQWSIFAMHNLLENNPENQREVAALKLDGLADNVQQLQEFGVDAQLVGGRIVVRKSTDMDTQPAPSDR